MSEGPLTAFDAVVVGAGPAGSAAALQLARAGWSVALVERQHFPRRKVCGECVAASNLPLLHALGIGAAFDAAAGPALQRVRLLAGDEAIAAALPAAAHNRHRWGRALGRETLDVILLEQARAEGVAVLQPCILQTIQGTPGRWHCDVRPLGSAALLRLRSALVIDAHGSWDALPFERPRRRLGHNASDLFAFKANFTGSSLLAGDIAVLTLDGGYGGMVVADAGMVTVACCIRRDRLARLRSEAPGARAGDVVEAFLRRACAGVRQALDGAAREGPWLTSGPLATGMRIDATDDIFRIGNAAGEAHPILGEGLSMALQSAALLCSHLLGRTCTVPDAAAQAGMQRRYAAAWRKAFAPRLRLAAVFAHLAMRPGGTALLMALLHHWPGLLTQGARWGGKVRLAAPLASPAAPRASGRASAGAASRTP
ncbi:NAD(P)/FAD-dependent oxidoreductase [Azohydromonas lata]|uniref:NAD(P)/FAD-dependent oxidoreductase n=1 Tax=Azohydromonas lata TaxID=45677 RepID=UPI000829DF37|nr:FAD-dependent oxidoreductase [Azohydromonas lata]